jgi:hypothetical protein
LLKASTYWRTAAIGSFVLISLLFAGALKDGKAGMRLISQVPYDALFWDHCIWSSMLEKAALSFSAFLISSALT